MLNKWLKKLSPKPSHESSATKEKEAVFHKGDLEKTIQRINEIFGETTDLVVENIQLSRKNSFLCYLSTLTDWQVVTEKVVDPLNTAKLKTNLISSNLEWRQFCLEFFSGTKHQFIQSENKIVEDILNGHALLFSEEVTDVLSIQIKKIGQRTIEEPSTQTIIRGPKDGFIEDIDTNVSLIRRRIKNPSLRFKAYNFGNETNTKVYLAYVNGIVKQKTIDEIHQRLSKIKINALLDSGILEELIEDKTFTPFPLLYNTERPDVVAAHLLSGKFALVVDGSPFLLTAPVTFTDFIAMSEDYYQTFFMGTFIRLVRYLAFLIALLLPALYVSIISYHHEMIPTQLIISLISQREGIPFPAVVEALLMEITFEILREAGIRMPRAVGGTISIVGGLVIGQAAVEAGIVSNIMVIVVALTAISSFVSPVYDFAISTRILRFSFIILGSILGLYGIFLGIIAMVAHITSLRSFGVPYLAPIAPFNLSDQKDIFVRFPTWAMTKRPSYLETEQPEKQPITKSPSPPKKGDGEK